METSSESESPAPQPVIFPRRWIVASIVATLFAAAVTAPWSAPAAVGILMGGGAGALAFTFLIRQMASLRGVSPQLAVRRIHTGVLVRLSMYGAVLMAAFALDRETLHVFMGAFGGLILARTVVVAAGAFGARHVLRRLSSKK